MSNADVDEKKEFIDTEQPPKIFQDTIAVASKLSLRDLWVDALLW